MRKAWVWEGKVGTSTTVTLLVVGGNAVWQEPISPTASPMLASFSLATFLIGCWHFCCCCHYCCTCIVIWRRKIATPKLSSSSFALCPLFTLKSTPYEKTESIFALGLWPHCLSWPAISCFGPRVEWTQWTVFSDWGKQDLGFICGRQRPCTIGCLSHSVLKPSIFFFFFFLVIKTSSSFQTP